MRRYLITAMILGSMSTFGVTGCDKTTSETTKTTSSPDGSSSTSKEKTVEHPDGSMTTEQKSKSTTSNP